MNRGQSIDYDFGNKRQYRRAVWNMFSQAVGPGRASETRALLMPGISGDEIAYALAKGFRLGNLVALDKNPAVAATIRRRWPGLGDVIGLPVSRAYERLSKPVYCANLDLCAPISRSLLDEIAVFARQAPLSGHPVVAVTMLRGREPPTMHRAALGVAPLFDALGVRRFGAGRLCPSFEALSDADRGRVITS